MSHVKTHVGKKYVSKSLIIFWKVKNQPLNLQYLSDTLSDIWQISIMLRVKRYC